MISYNDDIVLVLRTLLRFFFIQTRAAVMATCGWWAVRLSTRGEWKCAVTRCGGPCATTSGIPMTLLWYVDNWDTLLQVSSAIDTIYYPHVIL